MRTTVIRCRIPSRPAKKCCVGKHALSGDQQSLQPTALVNEAYLCVVNHQPVSFLNRTQFYGMRAKLIRDLLVGDTRGRLAEKRGGDAHRGSLTGAEAVSEMLKIDLLALDEALCKLATNNPQQNWIVCLQCFGGLTIAETLQIDTAARGEFVEQADCLVKVLDLGLAKLTEQPPLPFDSQSPTSSKRRPAPARLQRRGRA